MKIIHIGSQLFCCGIAALPLFSEGVATTRFLALVDIAAFWLTLTFVSNTLCKKDSSG